MHFFCFPPEISFMVKIGLKNQNYHFKLKYGTSYDLNMPNSMMLFNFFVFGRKYFFGQIWSKNQNYHFKLKFGGWLNSNMQNSMMLFTFFVFDRKCPFGANLVQIVNIASLRWNLIPTLIRICRIQWCCSFFFCFWLEICFWGQIWFKKWKFSV